MMLDGLNAEYYSRKGKRLFYMFVNGAWMPLFYVMYSNLNGSLILGTQDLF